MQTFPEAGIEAYWVSKSNNIAAGSNRGALTGKDFGLEGLRQAVGKEAGRQ
jgi:hypothetical protein